jgi:mannose-6-phosphate isomerase
LHPNDELAKERHNSFGKTEMWYVMQADADARLVVGFKRNSNQNEYLEALENINLVSLLNEFPVKQGDVFFLETGTIHAIGAGVVVAEIQQTSDITYRIYDWDRVDANGKGRELHTELALDAINFNTTDAKIDYSEVPNESSMVVSCPYFNTNIIALQDHYIWKKTKESFTVFMCTNGQFEVIINGEIMQYQMGDTLLMPAIIEQLTLRGKATLLEISI